MGNALSDALKNGGSDSSSGNSGERESAESRAERVRGEKDNITEDDLEDKPQSSESSGSGGTKSSTSSVSSSNSVDGGSVSDSASSGSSTKEKAQEKTKKTLDKVKEAFDPRKKAEDSVQAGKNFIKERGLKEAENIKQKVREEMPVQSVQNRETIEAFTRNVQVEEDAEQKKSRTERQIERLESSDVKGQLILEGEKGTEKVSKDEAVSRLESQKDMISDTIESARKNQEIIAQAPQRSNEQVIPYSEIEGMDRSDFLSREDEDRRRPTDLNQTQYSSGTNIYRGRSGILADPEARDSIEQAEDNVKTFGTLLGTRAGFTAPATLVSSESFSEEVEEQKAKAESRGLSGNVVESLSSPGALGVFAGAGKVAGTGVKYLQARGVGTGVGGKAVEVTGKVGGSALLGQQLGKGTAQARSGDVTEGVGRILQVSTEAGALAKGFQKASNKYGSRLGSTKVTQKNILEETGSETLEGIGKATAKTNIVQRVPFQGKQAKDLENVGEAVTNTKYRISSGPDKSTTRGTLEENIPGQGTKTKQFESISNVESRTDDVVTTKNILRTESEGPLFRSFDSTSTTSRTRKEAENSISEVQSIDVVNDLEESVTRSIKNKNIDARSIQTSSFSDQGRTFTETETIVLGEKNSGPGGFSGGGSGQGTVQSGGGGRVLSRESSRQQQFGESLGKSNRRQAQSQLNQNSKVLGSTGSGGNQAGNTDAELGQEFETRQGTVPEETSQNLSFSRLDTGNNVELESRGTETTTSGPITRRNRQGLTNKNTQIKSSYSFSRSETSLKRKQGTGLKLRNNQKVSRGTIQKQRPQVQGFNQRNRLNTASTQKTGLATIQSLQRIQVPGFNTQNISRINNVSTSSTTTRPGTPGGLFDLDLEFESRPGETTSTENKAFNGVQRTSIKKDILSANRSELVTGSKTFNVENTGSSTAFSGGLKTQEEKQLGPRKLLPEKNDSKRFY